MADENNSDKREQIDVDWEDLNVVDKDIDLHVPEKSVKDVVEESRQKIDIIDDGNSEMDFEDESVWDVLGQMGISKGAILKFVAILVLILLGFAGFSFGWFNSGGIKEFFGGIFGAGGAKSDPVVVETPIETPAEPDFGRFDQIAGVINAYIFGLEYAEFQPLQIETLGSLSSLGPIDLALGVGYDGRDFENILGGHVERLRKMNALYRTDIYAMLDQATRRDVVLDEYVHDFESVLDEAKEQSFELTALMNNLELNYTSIVEQKDIYENEFLGAISAYEGIISYDNYAEFLRYSKMAMEVKATFNAYKMLTNMYAQAINVLEPRLRDVQLNYDALIKGVKVFEVPNSNIDAIVPVLD